MEGIASHCLSTPTIYLLSIQQCLPAHQGEGRCASGVCAPATENLLPQLLALALAVPGGPRGVGRPSVLSILKISGKGESDACLEGLSCSWETQQRHRLVRRTCHCLVSRPCSNSPGNRCCFLPCRIAYQIATQQIK